MKNKFKIGDKVRNKITKRIYTVEKIGTMFTSYIYWVEECVAYLDECILKKYTPSRTGKYRNEKGQFTQYEKVICSWCDKWFGDIGKHLMTCPMRKAAQEQREQFSWTDVSDSKQRNYQKIELIKIKDGNGSQVDKNFEVLAKRLNEVIEKVNSL